MTGKCSLVQCIDNDQCELYDTCLLKNGLNQVQKNLTLMMKGIVISELIEKQEELVS